MVEFALRLFKIKFHQHALQSHLARRICESKITFERKKTMVKYSPKSCDELKELINDESVNLGDIDTSAIDDMSNLFEDSKREDFSGIEKWNVSSVEEMSDMFEYSAMKKLPTWYGAKR